MSRNTAPAGTLWNLPALKPAEPRQQIPDFGPAPAMTPRMTSRIARKRIAGELNEKQRTVLAFIRESGGCTDEEGIEATGMDNGWRARRGELAAAELIENSGQTRPTKCGNPAVVWKAKGA